MAIEKGRDNPAIDKVRRSGTVLRLRRESGDARTAPRPVTLQIEAAFITGAAAKAMVMGDLFLQRSLGQGWSRSEGVAAGTNLGCLCRPGLAATQRSSTDLFGVDLLQPKLICMHCAAAPNIGVTPLCAVIRPAIRLPLPPSRDRNRYKYKRDNPAPAGRLHGVLRRCAKLSQRA